MIGRGRKVPGPRQKNISGWSRCLRSKAGEGVEGTKGRKCLGLCWWVAACKQSKMLIVAKSKVEVEDLIRNSSKVGEEAGRKGPFSWGGGGCRSEAGGGGHRLSEKVGKLFKSGVAANEQTK